MHVISEQCSYAYVLSVNNKTRSQLCKRTQTHPSRLWITQIINTDQRNAFRTQRFLYFENIIHFFSLPLAEVVAVSSGHPSSVGPAGKTADGG